MADEVERVVEEFRRLPAEDQARAWVEIEKLAKLPHGDPDGRLHSLPNPPPD